MVASVALLCAPNVAGAYEGGWEYDNNAGGSEILLLGDNSDGSHRMLGGTAAACGAYGASYASMRSTISGGGTNNDVSWWVDADCGDIVRVCVQNVNGRQRCSTYRDFGWQ